MIKQVKKGGETLTYDNFLKSSSNCTKELKKPEVFFLSLKPVEFELSKLSKKGC